MTNTEEARTIVHGARDLLQDPGRWTQGASARDALGFPVSPVHVDACRWDAGGAVIRVSQNESTLFVLAYLITMVFDEYPRHTSLRGVNDNEGHESVIRVFDIALSLLDRDEVMRL